MNPRVIPAGPIIYLEDNGEVAAITDVYTHLNNVRAHYQKIGLSEADVQKIVR